MRYAIIIAVIISAMSGSLAATSYDFSTEASVTIMGPDAASVCKSGYTVATGDIDNDGKDDFVIAAPGMDYPGGAGNGAVFVIWGNSTFPAKINLDRTSPPAVDGADLTLYGRNNDGAGKALAVADVNQDNYDDILIGAPDNNRGTVFIIYGRARSSFPSSQYWYLQNTAADVVITGETANDKCGISLASGDLNGDNYQDIIIGAPDADGPSNIRTEAGEVYVIYGSGNLPATLDLSSGASVSFFATGAHIDDHLGDAGALAAGDVNGDGLDDLLMGAWGADKRDGTGSCEGQAYLIYGSASLPASWDLNTTAANYTLYGIDTNDRLGDKVASGDLNGDGCAEIIMTAINGDGPGNTRLDCGEVYTVLGGNLSGYQELVVTPANFIAYGGEAGDKFGFALCARSVKYNSAYKDLEAGAPRASGPSNTRPQSGETYIFYGTSSLPATWDLNSTAADITLYGISAGDESASSVIVGDFDGNLLPDLFVGAPLVHTGGGARIDDGECYVKLGVLPHGVTGTVTFEDSSYTSRVTSIWPGNNLYVEVRDTDLDLNPAVINTAAVSLLSTASPAGDLETLTVTETGVNTGIFHGTMATTTDAVSVGNNILEVVAGETVTVTYIDALDALGQVNQSRRDSVLVLVPGGGGTAATRVLARFTDSAGITISTYRLGSDGIYVTVTDLDPRFNPASVETVSVTITEPHLGDRETITLTETTASSEVFRNLTALPSKSSASPIQNDGILETLVMDSSQVSSIHLQALGGNTLTATYTNQHDSSLIATATASMLTAVNRITPVSYPDRDNPGSIILRYYLNSDTQVHLFIYDITANLIASEVYAAGSQGGKGGVDNIVRWNGQTDYNALAGNGVYIFRLASKSGDAYSLLGTGKIYLIR